MDWPEPVERVAGFLRGASTHARLEEFSAETPTAEAAAEAVGCKLAQIVKSLVLVCDDRALLVLVPGDRRADLSKIAAAAQCAQLRVARAAEVEAATGFKPGAVAPFPLPGVDRVFAERTLLVHDLVWAGGGSHNHLVAIPPAELVRLARARTMDAVEDGA